jgi:uncharacterized protein
MNRALSLVILFALLCPMVSLSANERAQAERGDAPYSNLELVTSGYAAFAAGNMDAVMALLAPELIWHEADSLPYGGVYHGPEAVMENIFSAITQDWDQYEAEPLRFIDAGDHIVVLGEYRGIHRESGKVLQAPFAHFWRMKNGRLIEFHQFTDTMAWMEAAGLARTVND